MGCDSGEDSEKPVHRVWVDEFLLAGDVFSTDQISSYIELKWNEVYRFEHTPHPVEFEMYYSV